MTLSVRLLTLTTRVLRVLFLVVAVVAVLNLLGAFERETPPHPLALAGMVGSLSDPAPLTPVDVVTPFRPPASRYGPGHRGVDLGGSVGQPIVATAPGRVSFVGVVAGVGVVVVDVGFGQRLSYEPVTPDVTANQAVKAGDRLGTLLAGHPGCPVAACLHWGLVVADGPPRLYADPMSLLGYGTVRLLPWEGEPA